MNVGEGDDIRSPAALMMRGRFKDAIELLVRMYVEAAGRGDKYIGRDLCAQLLYCLGVQNGVPPEEAVQKVADLVRAAMEQRGLPVEESVLSSHLEAAQLEIAEARRKSEERLEEPTPRRKHEATYK